MCIRDSYKTNLNPYVFVKSSQVLSTAETTFVRKGGAGGWKDYFSDDSERVINELAGEALRKLRYLP